MVSNQTKQNDVDPMRIAWLLRADLRQGQSASAPISNWFRVWWIIHGSREYPAWAGKTALNAADLLKPQAGTPNYYGFGMSPALEFLLDTNPDLASKFDLSTENGLWDAIAWFFVHGVYELRLTSALDEATLASLDASPPFIVENALESGDVPDLTWLMYFAWRISSDLRKTFDISDRQGKRAYLTWFLFKGVPQLKLEPLVAQRWKEWLRESVLENKAKIRVPRAAYLLWQQHLQLQRAFDLSTDQGIAALAMWSAEVSHTQEELSWIDHAKAASVEQTSTTNKRPFGLNLIGFAFGELGIGEDVRMAVAACEAAGIPFSIVNIHPGDNLRQADQALAVHVAKAVEHKEIAPYAYNIFCLTAFDTARVFLERGELFRERFNIGWWPWELPVWPSDWRPVFDLVDEIWAATSYTYRMYTDAIVLKNVPYVPVTLMPMAASVERVETKTRSALNLPEDRFLFLYVFDFNSHLARKNPFAAVDAFRHAFDRSDDSVALVLKTMNADTKNQEWIKFLQECALDDRIIILESTMERGEVLGLIQACDGYVSLHRAEGFGRTLAEAMLFGRAVVSTDFSGSADFVIDGTGYPVQWNRTPVKLGEYPFITDNDAAWWAEPSIKSAAMQMRICRDRSLTPYSRKQDIETVINIAQERFSPLNIGLKIKKRLQKIASLA